MEPYIDSARLSYFQASLWQILIEFLTTNDISWTESYTQISDVLYPRVTTSYSPPTTNFRRPQIFKIGTNPIQDQYSDQQDAKPPEEN